MTEEVLALIEEQLVRVEASGVGGDWNSDGGYLAVASPRVVRQLVDEMRRLCAFLMTQADEPATAPPERTSGEPEPASEPNNHPDGCHAAGPGELRDCESDGHYSCRTCSRRVERDQ